MLVYLNLIEGRERKDLFARIYEENYLRMYHIAFAILKRHADAEDAVHEAFLSIAKHFRKYSKLSCREMEGLCVTIVKSKVMDQLRRSKKYSDEELENLILYNEYEEFDPEKKLLRDVYIVDTQKSINLKERGIKGMKVIKRLVVGILCAVILICGNRPNNKNLVLNYLLPWDFNVILN